MKANSMAGPIRWFLKWGASRMVALIALFPLFSIPAVVSAAAKPGAKELPGPDIFNASNIVRISITIPERDMRLLGQYHWGGGWGRSERPEGKATVSDGKNVYKNVAVHLKGAAGSFRPIFSDKPALTLNFDKFEKGQTFHGLQKISLNNSVQDPTFIQEKLCRELFEAAGVPVPRADYAVVTLNGRNQGLYVLVEGFNKQLLRRYFKNVSGNLYDGGFCQDVTESLSVNSGDKPDDRTDLRRLLSAAGSGNSDSLKDLEKVLDVERFLSFVAMEDMLVHWDGYTMNRNNYRVYHDVDADRMVFMPHGMDQMFGMSPQGSTHTRIIPPLNGYIAQALLNNAEGRTRYLKRFAELRTNVFQLEAVTNRVRELEARIQPVLAEVRPGSAARHHSMVNYLVSRIEERWQFLDEQLNLRNREMAFDQHGSAKLEGWRPKSTMGMGKFDRTASENGRQALHIIAENGNNSASSWRTRVFLKPGRYRFEGFGKTAGTGRDSDSGAQLRISGSPARPSLRGDSDWTKLSFGFEVPEPGMEVELVCELKGPKGEAWFDAGSLRLRRVE
jgi:hypothetical protein